MPIVNGDLRIYQRSGLSFPWAEFVSKKGGLQQSQMGHDSVTSSLPIVIYWQNLNLAIKEIIGFSKRVGANNLSRTIPMKHPFWENLWCTQITNIKGIKFNGKEILSHGVSAKYKYAVLTLKFSRPSYSIFSDTDPAILALNGKKNEWKRFVTTNWKPTFQMLSRERQQWVFSAGLPTGQQFPAPLGYRLPKTDIIKKWHQLPYEAVFNSDEEPEKILAYLGRVNSVSFLGSPPYTLFFKEFTITPRPLPLPAELMGYAAGTNPESYPLQYDLEFTFEKFEPPPGINTNGTSVGQFGHLSAPWAGDGRFYPIQSTTITTTVNGQQQSVTQVPLEIKDLSEVFRIR